MDTAGVYEFYETHPHLFRFRQPSRLLGFSSLLGVPLLLKNTQPPTNGVFEYRLKKQL
jgi:hypothetical protein